jgi:hypothetical protein
MNGLCDDGGMQSERPQGVSPLFINVVRPALRLAGLRMTWPPSGAGKRMWPIVRIQLSFKFTEIHYEQLVFMPSIRPFSTSATD